MLYYSTQAVNAVQLSSPYGVYSISMLNRLYVSELRASIEHKCTYYIHDQHNLALLPYLSVSRAQLNCG